MRKPRPQAMLDQDSQARLGERLRRMYDSLPNEPLPEDLQVLLGALADPAPPNRSLCEAPVHLERAHFERGRSGRSASRDNRSAAAAPAPAKLAAGRR